MAPLPQPGTLTLFIPRRCGLLLWTLPCAHSFPPSPSQPTVTDTPAEAELCVSVGAFGFFGSG